MSFFEKNYGSMFMDEGPHSLASQLQVKGFCTRSSQCLAKNYSYRFKRGSEHKRMFQNYDPDAENRLHKILARQYEEECKMRNMSNSVGQREPPGSLSVKVDGSRARSLKALPKSISPTSTGSGKKCDVCNVSPVRDTHRKCKEFPDYDICPTCYEDTRKMQDMSHSIRQKEHQSELFEEFITVMGNFIQTLDNEIVSIRKVQNTYLWEFYFFKRKQMEHINGKIGANEMNLFHGTKPDIIQTVCANNLDMRLAGTNTGSIYGNGTYFASSAKTSEQYSTPDPKTGHKFMLQCRVLVGRWTKGQHGLRRPPEVEQTSDGYVRLYDSCVDNVDDPSIFCIFDHVQYYPEYIIEYK
ncbi:protein mono-ADP-ribosyltransferase PARP11-like isoform X2 [Dreissena polymorpha]|uniref:protein mono-ADP-ribosyltransferase PARP11-like isoform X2 n=1 Tax=Dreissena polymorpha TaxID=45954 RepID=UPI0022646937|nr:protein mono-ADP-ribosyltransferase PARP11-like isoform X2 [Dreissena polymorpha]